MGEPTDRGAPKRAPLGSLGHPLSDGPLPHGKIMDAGLQHYDEFACSHSTLSWLRASGLPTVDGEPANLQVVENCVGGHNMIVRVWTGPKPC